MGAVVLAVLGVLILGMVATLCMTLLMFASQKLGMSRMNWALLVGTLFTGDRHMAFVLGFVINFGGGCLFAFLYFLLFALLGETGWRLGTLVGTVHGAVVLVVVLPVLSYAHPRIATEYDGASARKRLEPPGFLALNYGYRTPLATLFAYMVYGAILGAGFTPLFELIA